MVDGFHHSWLLGFVGDYYVVFSVHLGRDHLVFGKAAYFRVRNVFFALFFQGVFEVITKSLR